MATSPDSIRERVRASAREAARSDGVRSARDRVRFFRQDLQHRMPRISGIAYLFISPFFILFGIFLAFPVFYTLYLSFFEYQGFSDEVLLYFDLGVARLEIPRIAELQFVGLDNYWRLLSGISLEQSSVWIFPYLSPTPENLFWQAMFNTTYIFLFQVPIMIGLALALALALNSALIRFKGIFRTVIALPVAANIVAYSTIFLLVFNETGFLNTMLATIGVEGPAYLRSEFWARWTIIGAVTWRWTGYNMIILLAGLQTIPQHLYEAAEIDGANRFEKFRYVTLPQLRPVLLFVVVLSTIGTFRLFAEPFVITGGGPANSTMTIVQYIYVVAFQRFELGVASAATYIFIFIVSTLSILQIRYGGED
jgi:multiple sugar transport system permease protein/lactose/L-arabinose transport system permease protein